MKRLLKWSGLLALGIVLLAGMAGIAAFGVLRQSVAPVSGEATLGGLSAQVSIHKDAHAIPHVEAESRADALRALGWLHASERIWQMEVLRMAGQGRLSEMFGAQTVSSDRFLQTLDLPRYSRASFDVLRSDSRALVEAYAQGVNAWLNRETGTFEPSLPVEFVILGHAPEAWEPWHSLAILKVMALTLDANLEEEIGRMALAAKGFGPRQIEEVYPAGPRDNPPPLPDLRELYGFASAGKSFDSESRVRLAKSVEPATAPWTLQLPASNNWVISGSKSESGQPLLANDPHLGLTAPSTFYLAHLRWKEGGEVKNLIGGSLPGTPLILSGRNDDIAWGLTTTYLDSQDVFLEQVMPDAPDRYRTPDGSLAFETQDVTIKVKGGEDVAYQRRSTRHGPVLPDGYMKLAERLPEGHVAALAWTALAEDDTTMQGALDIAVATSVDDFFLKTRSMMSPMQSIVVADKAGNTGIIAPARVPMRSDENTIAGRAPVPGWLDEYGWQGFLPRFRLPQFKNPPGGVLGSANSNWLPATYNEHITYDWAEPYRQQRLDQLYTNANSMQNLATMTAGQADTLSLALLAFRDEALLQIPQGVRLNEEITAALRQWDGHMETNRPEPVILVAWHRNLLEAMLRDDLGGDFDLVHKGRISRVLEMLQNTGTRNWCDRTDTPKVESCGDILFASAEAALDELRASQGTDWRQWRWGTASKTLHEHRPFSQVGALASFFTIREEMAGGTYTLLRNSHDFSKDDPYAGRHGSAFRGAYDFADLEGSLFMISSGQSGNIFSPHYSDLAKKWAKLEYVTIPSDPDTYRTSASGVLRLNPTQ